MKIIGLTGPTGSGKSTVAKLLKEKGFAIIDCDLVAREVVEKAVRYWIFCVKRSVTIFYLPMAVWTAKCWHKKPFVIKTRPKC